MGMGRRQDEPSARVARNSQLLRTRVDLALKRQNQLVLDQMNQRARLQLRLQETMEGLSVVAIAAHTRHQSLGTKFYSLLAVMMKTPPSRIFR